jgi:hypothetical protein
MSVQDSTDSASVATNYSTATTNYSTAATAMPRAVYKSLRREIRAISDPDKMIEAIFNSEEELHQLPTRLLNTWSLIDGWTFKRRSGILHFEPVEKKAIRTLQDQVNELRNIIKILIANNNLRLPDDVDDQVKYGEVD